MTLPLTATELQRYRQALLHLCEVRQNADSGVRKKLSEHYPNVPVSIQLTAKHQKHRLLERAILHIDRHFRENVDQKELAQLCGMTPSRFSRLFKDAYGVCYLEYVLSKRMEFAKDRLDNSQMPITTIGYEAGFRDPSYFARAFKQFTGLTPSEYRQAANVPAAAQASSLIDMPIEPLALGYDILA
ncbi:AraC family transcriptional regulator [Stutzerimonas xanthomarina]|nr:AraC family transcriptional regulator [Stutzerimonas xanthomarina]MDX2351017.1 AraC family transcriptional regulator [Stutzerimonas xanthomarina]